MTSILPTVSALRAALLGPLATLLGAARPTVLVTVGAAPRILDRSATPL